MRRRALRTSLLVPLLAIAGCPPTPIGGRDDAGAAHDAPALDASSDATTTSSDAGEATDAAASDAPLVGADDASLSDASIPNLYACSGSASMHLVFANTGTSTWRPGEVALVAVDGSDPFAASTHALTAPVAPGESATFDVATTAPSTGGAYVSDWRLARGTSAFGATAARAIAVNCAGIDSIDLSSAVIHTSPAGAAAWPITTRITSLDIAPTGGVGNGGIVVDFTKRDGADRWPDVPFLGGTDTVQHTLWMVLRIGGAWHMAGAQQYWHEADLRMCGIPSGWTTNLFYDAGRWGEMSGFPLAEGDLMGIFVAAGDHRSRTDTDGSSILERSAVVLIPFPGDTTIVDTLP
ncbi:MAG: NBR1-Ig-like domain-containing protein [Sandaracinus sp.]